jgi:hypothetical protein
MTGELPAPGDPSQHLWILRWYRACLSEGRSPLVCPELQYPVGAPLNGFSPLHLQAALFLPLSRAVGNDLLSYNLLWTLGLVTTGLGTFALAWSVVRDRASACLAGLSAMLSGPVMLHSQGHLRVDQFFKMRKPTSRSRARAALRRKAAAMFVTPSSRSLLIARFRRAASTCAPAPVRVRLASSPIVTSRT